MLFKLGLRNNAWLKERFLCAILGGMSRMTIQAWTETYINQLTQNEFRHAALKQLRYHQAEGHSVVLATASFDIYVDELARRLGIQRVISTRAEWSCDACLSGRIDGKNCYGAEKLQRLKQTLSADRSHYRIIAYSDHHSDLPLLLFADEGVAVHPTPRLKSVCAVHGLKIVEWS
jgi:phosphatidylglycerophosphatase C